MHPRSPKLLEDIRDAAGFIREVTQGRTLERYGADPLDHALVWSTVERQVPALVRDIENLLAEPH